MFEGVTNAHTGEFAFSATRPGPFTIWAVAEGHGRVDLAELEVVAGELHELGELRAPAPRWVQLEFDGPAPTTASPWVLETGGRCNDLEGRTITLFETPVRGFELLPGPYRLRPMGYPKPFEPQFTVDPNARPVLDERGAGG